MNRTLLLALGVALLAGCPSDDDETDTETDDTEDTDTVEPPIVSVTGGTSEIFSGAAAAEGLCVHALDPSPSLADPENEPNILASTTVAADGTYTLEGIDVREALAGMFILVTDCADEGTVFPTATGIAASTYENAVAGDQYERNALFLSATTAAGFDASLQGVGSTKSLSDGAVLGFVLDASGTPVADATLDCSTCGDAEIYYVDADPTTGGLLAGAEGLNTATQAGLGLTFVPAGPVGNYEVTHASLNIAGGLFGSIKGIVSVTAWSEAQ